MPESKTTLYLPPFEIDPDLFPSKVTQPDAVIESLATPNLLIRISERIAKRRKVVDLSNDLTNCDSKTRTVLSGAGIMGLFATGPFKLGTVLPLTASMEVLQTIRPGVGGIAAGIAAGIASGVTYGALVRGGNQVIINGVEHFPRYFGVKEDNDTDVMQEPPGQTKKSHAALADISLGVKCNMMSSALMIAESTQGRSKKDLTSFSNRLSWAGAFVMFAASTAVAETVVVSGHPELAQEIQDKIHDPRYLGSLTLALLAIDGVNYLRKNGLSSIFSKWANSHPSDLAVSAQNETVETK